MEPIKVSKDPVSNHIISIDIGLDGGIYKNGIAYPMPTTEIIIKAPVMVQALDKAGKKVIIKSGPDKGQVKMKIKTPAVTKRELDVFKIKDLFESNNKQTMHPKTQHHERITPAKATTFALTKRVISYRYQYFRKTAD